MLAERPLLAIREGSSTTDPMKIRLIFLLFTAAIISGRADDSVSAASSQPSDDGNLLLSILGYLLSAAVIGGGIGAAIGSRKGSVEAGFYLGTILGPLGWLIAAVSKGNRINCPACRELIDPYASVCPKCHVELNHGKLVHVQKIPEPEPTIPAPPKRAALDLVRVGCDGKDLGNVSPQKLCDMIAGGQLTLQDHFFDAQSNQWLTLDRCPLISVELPTSP